MRRLADGVTALRARRHEVAERPEELPAGEEDFTPLSLLIAGAGFSFIAGLVLLGVAARRAHGLPPRWRALPFAVGVLAVPGIMIGGVLSELRPAPGSARACSER